VAAIHDAFATALNDILMVGGSIAFTGAVLCLILVRESDFVPSGAPEPARAAAAVG
jgi:hypothetical protein